MSKAIVQIWASVFASYLAFSTAALAQSNEARPLVSGRIDENQRVTLAGATRPEATPANDRGAVSDGLVLEHLQLILRRPAEREQALEKYIDQTTDKTSPNYHHWLTAVQIGKDYGPAPQDIDAVTGWLKTHGLRVNAVYPNGFLVDFSATAGQIRDSFGTEIHNLSVKGEHHIANMRDPSVPAVLAPAIIGIASLNDFMPKPRSNIKPARASSPNNTQPPTCYQFSYPFPFCQDLAPADFQTVYNIKPLLAAGITGAGQTIAVLEDSDPYLESDFATFRSIFGLSGYTTGSISTVHPTPGTGVNNCQDPGVNLTYEGEASGDSQAATEFAPGAQIIIAACKGTSTLYGADIALVNLLNSSTPPDIITMSYIENGGFGSSSLNSFGYLEFQQAAAEGVSVFLADGDSGANCIVDYAPKGSLSPDFGICENEWASTPYDVAVGGTDFGDTYAGTNALYWSPTNSAYYGSVLSYIPEITWDGTCASVMISLYFSGSPVTYGKNGFCNSAFAAQYGYVFEFPGAGGGAPSSCATGTPAPGMISGGSCKGYPKPSWQKVFGNPGDGVRDTPDVSLMGSFGAWGHWALWCDSAFGGTCGGPSTMLEGGGTSGTSPYMAGIQALVNQKKGGRQGNAAPIYYQLAAAEYGKSGNANCNASLGTKVASSCIFYDITTGDTDVPCNGKIDCYRPSGPIGVLSTSSSHYLPAYVATKGWDFTSGIGTVNAANLVNNWP